MAPPSKFMQMVEASQDEAQLAVRLYNDPAESRSFEAFIVHMHVAWLYLLHAAFARDKVDCRYWRTVGKRRFLERIDGEPKQWELTKSVRERWVSDQEPVRANLEFFIGLRNKIEHRYARRAQLALTAILGGQAQALLLNYEEELVAQFGVEHSLATRLRFPVFIGSFTTTGEQTLLRLRKQLPAALLKYIAGYEADLSPAVVNDPRFELRLRVFQELAPKAGPDTLPIQYTRFDDMTDEQKTAVLAAGKKGLVVTKVRRRSVLGHGLWKPTRAAAEVERQIPFRVQRCPLHCSVEDPRGPAPVQVRPSGADRREVLHLRRTTQGLWVHRGIHQEVGTGLQHRRRLPEGRWEVTKIEEDHGCAWTSDPGRRSTGAVGVTGHERLNTSREGGSARSCPQAGPGSGR